MINLNFYNSNTTSFKEVANDNKSMVLQQEANNIAHILQIDEFPVKLVQDENMLADGCFDETAWKADSSVLEIPTHLSVLSSIIYIASFSRFLWRVKHGLSCRDAEYDIDNAQFIVGYFFHGLGKELTLTGYINETGAPIAGETSTIVDLEYLRRDYCGNKAKADWIKNVLNISGEIYVWADFLGIRIPSLCAPDQPME